MIGARLGCSTISFRHLDLGSALSEISRLGFGEIDLGSLPGVCNHVPIELTKSDVDQVADLVKRSGLTVRSINCDVGDLNDPRVDVPTSGHLTGLLELAAATGARALVLPNGALGHAPIAGLDADLDRVADNLAYVLGRAQPYGLDVWTESLHVFRLCCNLDRAAELTSRLDPEIGIVMDFSHIVASGGDPVRFVDTFAERISHVHIRDATPGRVVLDRDCVVDEPGNINCSVGRGAVAFGAGIDALHAAGFTGHYTLELETRDVPDDERPAATADAARTITALLNHDN
jgi:sugar phosphate isomerase/epimerase